MKIERGENVGKPSMDEIRDAIDSNTGWCTVCKQFTRECTEPDATGYDCPVCGQNTVMGAEEAILEGEIE